MAANNALRVTGLDFDTIRENLKTFIADKPQFKDYDFNSSALGTLLDLLAYNTYYNAFYANMAVNEGFLDSAQLRDSLVSRAKSLGYTPRSARGATATINIKFPDANTTTVDSNIIIPKGQQFTATVNSIPLTFSTTSSLIVSANSTSGFSANVDIIEGTPLTHRFTVTSSNTSFTVPNANVDTRFLDVTVQTNGINAVYTQASTLLEVNGNSAVYFLEETANNRPRLVFGDGVLGKRPDTGSTVFAEYRVSNPLDGNGANNFSATGTISGQANYTIETVSRATGGRAPESIESIRFNASKNFETQERAVTAEDYKRILLENASDIQSLFVYGGQDASPPVYGKVYISAVPTQGSVGIVGSSGSIKLQKRFRPELTRSTSYSFDFSHPIANPHRGHLGSVTSTNFTFLGQSCRFVDDGLGTMRIVVAGRPIQESILVRNNVGTVDYQGGIVTIDNFLPSDFEGNEISITINPTNQNIQGKNNTVLLIADSTINVVDDESNLRVGTIQNVNTRGSTFSVQEASLSGVLTY